MKTIAPWLLTGLLGGTALADEPPPTKLTSTVPEIKMGMQLLSGWGYTLANDTDPAPKGQAKGNNRFFIDRLYINFQPTLNENWSARVTPDILAPKTPGGQYGLRLKFGYVEGKKLADGNLATRFGMQPTPFDEPYDAAWGYRVLSKPPMDYLAVVPTSDLGASVAYTVGQGDIRLGVYNGEGYQSPKSADHKDLMFQFTQQFGGGLGAAVTALYGKGLGTTRLDKRIDAAALITWTGEPLRAGAEFAYLLSTPKGGDDIKGMIVSAFVVPQLGDIEIPIRFERYEPNSDQEKDETLRAIVGVSWNFIKPLKVVPNFQYEKKGDDALQTAFVHFEAKL